VRNKVGRLPRLRLKRQFRGTKGYALYSINFKMFIYAIFIGQDGDSTREGTFSSAPETRCPLLPEAHRQPEVSLGSAIWFMQF